MKKVYWKEIVKEDVQQDFLKNNINENIVPLLQFVKELTIHFIDNKINENIEVYIPKKDIEEYLNNKD